MSLKIFVISYFHMLLLHTLVSVYFISTFSRNLPTFNKDLFQNPLRNKYIHNNVYNLMSNAGEHSFSEIQIVLHQMLCSELKV